MQSWEMFTTSSHEPAWATSRTPVKAQTLVFREAQAVSLQTSRKNNFQIILPYYGVDDNLNWNENFKLKYLKVKGRIQVSVILTSKLHLRSDPLLPEGCIHLSISKYVESIQTLKSERTVFEFCPLQAIWPWPCKLPLLSLSFCIHKTGLLKSTLWVGCEG